MYIYRLSNIHITSSAQLVIWILDLELDGVVCLMCDILQLLLIEHYVECRSVEEIT